MASLVHFAKFHGREEEVKEISREQEHHADWQEILETNEESVSRRKERDEWVGVVAVEKCEKPGCEAVPKDSGRRCARHKQCEKPTCTTQKRGSTPYCWKHRECEESGCGTHNPCSRCKKPKKTIKEKAPKKECETENCRNGQISGYTKCADCGGGPRCGELNCSHLAASPSTPDGLRCVTHGGGHRCQWEENCTKPKVGNKTYPYGWLCGEHGGKVRKKLCHTENCTKLGRAPRKDGFYFCISCGGGHRCQSENCPNGAQGKTNYCRACQTNRANEKADYVTQFWPNLNEPSSMESLLLD